MHELKPIQCLPLALLWEAVMILDFVMVTLISNEGSSLAPLSPSDSGSSHKQACQGDCSASSANGKENPRDQAMLALWSNSDIAWKRQTFI